MSSTYMLAERNFRSTVQAGMPRTARALNDLQRFLLDRTTRFGCIAIKPGDAAQVRETITEARSACSAERQIVLDSIRSTEVTGVPLVCMKGTGDSISGTEILEPVIKDSGKWALPFRLLIGHQTLDGFGTMIERIARRIERDLKTIEERLER